jgi:hypothetical protein
MQRLPQATRVRRRGGDRQSHWGEDAHQKQNQQQSGSHTMHELQSCLVRSDEIGFRREKQFTTTDENRGHTIVKSLVNLVPVKITGGDAIYSSYLISTQRPPSVKSITKFITTNIKS